MVQAWLLLLLGTEITPKSMASFRNINGGLIPLRLLSSISSLIWFFRRSGQGLAPLASAATGVVFDRWKLLALVNPPVTAAAVVGVGVLRPPACSLPELLFLVNCPLFAVAAVPL